MIIQCPECQKEISDKAKKCPHCGFPVARTAKQAELAERATAYRTRIVVAAPRIAKAVGRNTIKLGVIAIICLCIGALKASMGQPPSFYASQADHTLYASIQNTLSNLVWWALMGLTRKFYGRRPIRVLWFFFMFFTAIPLLLNLFKMFNFAVEHGCAYFLFVGLPWVTLARCFYEPPIRKWKDTAPTDETQATKH